MTSAGDFRNGITPEINNMVCQIIEFQYMKPDEGAAFACIKIKSVITGAVTECIFCPMEKFPAVHIDRVEIQYFYVDNDIYNFVNAETYDQISLSRDLIGDALKFIKESEVVRVVSYSGNVFSVEPPFSVELEVTETEPDFTGSTVTGAQRPATVETGTQIPVPLFVSIGDRVKIDTRTSEYLGRVQN